MLILIIPIAAKPSNNTLERCVRVNRARQKYDKDEGVETIVSLNTEFYSLPSATTTNSNRRSRTPERECLLVKREEEKQQ